MSLPPPRAADSLELLSAKYGVPFYVVRIPENIYAHIRVLTKREERKYKRSVKRATRSAMRKRMSTLVFWLVFLAALGAIIKAPDPSTMPWAKPVAPPTTQVRNNLSTAP